MAQVAPTEERAVGISFELVSCPHRNEENRIALLWPGANTPEMRSQISKKDLLLVKSVVHRGWPRWSTLIARGRAETEAKKIVLEGEEELHCFEKEAVEVMFDLHEFETCRLLVATASLKLTRDAHTIKMLVALKKFMKVVEGEDEELVLSNSDRLCLQQDRSIPVNEKY